MRLCNSLCDLLRTHLKTRMPQHFIQCNTFTMANTTIGKSYYTKNNPVFDYIESHSTRLHPVHQELINETLTIYEPSQSAMMGAPEVLQMNQILMKTINAKKAIDVGVFTGASSLVAALALPEDGKVIACDVDKTFTDIGKKYWAKAGVADKIHLHLRPATETLQELIDNGEAGTFDFAFIDADKGNYCNYYEMCLKLLRPGGIITVDNVLFAGRVWNEDVQDERTNGIRKLNDLVAADDRVHITMQNIGDGLSVILKK